MRQFQLRGAEHGSIRALGRLNWNPSVFFDPAGPDRTSSFFGGRASSFPRAGADCASSAATFLFSAVPKRRSWGPSVVPTGGTCVNSSHGGAEHGSIRALGRLNRSPSVFLDPAWPDRTSSFFGGRAFSFSLPPACSFFWRTSFLFFPVCRSGGTGVHPWSRPTNMRQFGFPTRGAGHASIRAPDW